MPGGRLERVCSPSGRQDQSDSPDRIVFLSLAAAGRLRGRRDCREPEAAGRQNRAVGREIGPKAPNMRRISGSRIAFK
jgi:hypothetical protein